MAIRLRDRHSMSRMQPGGRAVTMSSAALKWTGLLLTCLSSLGVAVLQRGLLRVDTATQEELAAAVADPSSGAASLVSAAVTCSLIAAMAIPLYAKLVYEGWKRMENRTPLFLRMALCALVSEIPYDLAMSGRALDFDVQNPVWGLLVCAAMLEVLRIPKPRSRIVSALLQVLVVAGALAWTLLLHVYMGPALALLAALFYFLEGNRTLSTLGGAALTIAQFPAPLGMLFVYWYEPDEVKDARYPYLFYLLYPAQLLAFYLLGLLLQL